MENAEYTGMGASEISDSMGIRHEEGEGTNLTGSRFPSAPSTGSGEGKDMHFSSLLFCPSLSLLRLPFSLPFRLQAFK